MGKLAATKAIGLIARRGIVSNQKLCQLINLGVVHYGDAYRLQREIASARERELVPDTLLLLEHPPVLTLGRRANRANLLFSDEELRRRGVSVFQSTRGGDVTYHGPGQIVGYPILNLRRLKWGAAAYVHALEDVLIDVVRGYGLEARADPRYVGVWSGDDKIAAIGVAISGGITLHGFALNVEPDLSHFGLINPCGISDRGVTSLTRALGHGVSIPEARARIVESFGERFGYRVIPADVSELERLGLDFQEFAQS